MNPTIRRTVTRTFSCSLSRTFAHSLAGVCLLVLTATARAEQWTTPTPDELAMTSQPEAPGAAGVYLYKEEVTDDKLHIWSVYVRLKVLTEGGKDYANVELNQYHSTDNGGYTVDDIVGRTIHSDGTIIPFTGKPFEKLVERGQGYKEMAKVFTMPDVEVGSIIEYRYELRYDDQYFIAPKWYVQSDLYLRKGLYLWRPTNEQLVSKGEHGEQLTSSVAWAPVLPKGFEVKETRLPSPNNYEDGQLILELNVHDIPPTPDEEFMPPFGSLSYRVLFYYSPYRSVDEYWKNEGKGWSKEQDKFIGPGSKVKDAVKGLLAPSDTDDQKLHKIYAAVMTLDNTSFNREHSTAEEKSEGLGPAKTTDDIWERKRGNDDEIALLFVAMARAAGMKAYAMRVTNRDRNVFVESYLSFGQLDDTLAIVTIDGKEQYFDPGQRYCEYGHLAWKHTIADGVRQIDGGSALAETPGEGFSTSRTQRVADLTMDEHGVVAGTVKMTWMGAPALSWRQSYLRGDATGLNRDLRTTMEHLMPGGMDVEVTSIDNLDDYEKPFVVSYDVKGPIGSSTGKRLLLPVDIFEANAQPTFPHDKRETAIVFNYAHQVQDAMRITFPAGFSVESTPANEQIPLAKSAAYGIKVETTATNVTMHREFDLGIIVYKVEEYPDLRGFYTKFETKDQEPVILKVGVQGAVGQ